MIDTNYAKALVNAAATYQSVPATDIMGGSRRKDIVTARMCIAYQLRTEGFYSMGEIGSFLGRDHSTIHHALGRVERLIKCGDRETVGLLRYLGTTPAPHGLHGLPITSTREAEAVMRALIRVGGDIQVLAAALQEMAAKVTRQAELSIEEIRLREVA